MAVEEVIKEMRWIRESHDFPYRLVCAGDCIFSFFFFFLLLMLIPGQSAEDLSSREDNIISKKEENLSLLFQSFKLFLKGHLGKWLKQ